ncbi:MAG: FAD-dependent oxidoreductase [Lachnospiraceae bacterium]|nr:FAD-dependent oxidoreductase [Lachnospiraceae bacterium]
MYDVIIIGAGTAGLSAAVYAARASKRVLVLEETSYGGQIIYSPEVENYPGIGHVSGFQFATGLYEQAVGAGAEIRFEKADGIRILKEEKRYKIVFTDVNTYRTKTVIIATGSRSRRMGLDGEERLTGAGISYCATCDGAFFKGRTVAVYGGGNTALEEAVYLSGLCSKVYIIHRRNTFRAEQRMAEQLQQKNNIEYLMNCRVTAINGNEKLESLELSDGRVIESAALFVAIGREPQNDIYKDILTLDAYGYIIAGEDCRTSEEGIFAAGDCRTKQVRQLVTAASDGAVAALAAIVE